MNIVYGILSVWSILGFALFLGTFQSCFDFAEQIPNNYKAYGFLLVCAVVMGPVVWFMVLFVSIMAGIFHLCKFINNSIINKPVEKIKEWLLKE